MPHFFKEQPDELARRMILSVYGPDVEMPEFGLGVDFPGMIMAGRVSYNPNEDKVVLPIGNPFTGKELLPGFGFVGHDQSPAERRHAEELIGSIFHIPPEQVTDRHSTVYTVTHELGHWRPYRDVPGSIEASVRSRDEFERYVYPEADPSLSEIAYRESPDERLAAQNAAFVIQKMIQLHGDDAFPGLVNGWESPEHIAREGVASVQYMAMSDNYLWHAYAPNLLPPEIQALSAVIPEQGEEVPGSRTGRPGIEMTGWARSELKVFLGAEPMQPNPLFDGVHQPLAELMQRLPEADREILTTVALASGKMPTLGIDLDQGRQTVSFMNDFVQRLAFNPTLGLEGVLDAQSDMAGSADRLIDRGYGVVTFVESHADLYKVQEPLSALAHARLSDDEEALASGQKLPQSAADEQRRVMLEAYLDDVMLAELFEPKVSLAEVHDRQAEAALLKVEAGMELRPLDEWAFEHGMFGEPVVDQAWSTLSRHDRRLATDAQSPALRYVHDVASLSRADPTRILDDIARELEDNVPPTESNKPYGEWLLNRSFDRLLHSDLSSWSSTTVASRDAGDDVSWSDFQVGSVLDRSGQDQVWPGQLTELWQTRHVTDALETGVRSLDALDVVGLSPVVHRDAAMPDMSFVMMTVAVEDGVIPTLWGVPDVVGQPCKTLPLSAEPLEQDAGLALAALGDRMLMAKSGGLAGVAELTRVVDGLSAENLVDVAMSYPMTTKMPVLGGPLGRTFEDADAVTVVAGAAGIEVIPKTPGVADVKLEAEPVISHGHEMGMGW